MHSTKQARRSEERASEPELAFPTSSEINLNLLTSKLPSQLVLTSRALVAHSPLLVLVNAAVVSHNVTVPALASRPLQQLVLADWALLDLHVAQERDELQVRARAQREAAGLQPHGARSEPLFGYQLAQQFLHLVQRGRRFAQVVQRRLLQRPFLSVIISQTHRIGIVKTRRRQRLYTYVSTISSMALRR
jgi:hypothetical protein